MNVNHNTDWQNDWSKYWLPSSGVWLHAPHTLDVRFMPWFQWFLTFKYPKLTFSVVLKKHTTWPKCIPHVVCPYIQHDTFQIQWHVVCNQQWHKWLNHPHLCARNIQYTHQHMTQYFSYCIHISGITLWRDTLLINNKHFYDSSKM